MNKEQFSKGVEDKYQTTMEYIVRQRNNAETIRTAMYQAWSGGLFDPVKDAINFIASDGWTYISLPLNKQIFMGYVQELKGLGWQEGKLELGKSTAQMILKYDIPTAKGLRLVLVLSAYGEGVACKIVTVKPPVDFEAGVYEWVCEGGASEEEMSKAWGV